MQLWREKLWTYLGTVKLSYSRTFVNTQGTFHQPTFTKIVKEGTSDNQTSAERDTKVR